MRTTKRPWANWRKLLCLNSCAVYVRRSDKPPLPNPKAAHLRTCENFDLGRCPCLRLFAARYTPITFFCGPNTVFRGWNGHDDPQRASASYPGTPNTNATPLNYMTVG